MATLRVITGSARVLGSCVLMARVWDEDGTNILQGDLSSIHYSAYQQSDPTPVEANVVTGHDNVELTIADVIYDTLQSTPNWNGSSGYNFQFVPDRTVNEIFPEAGTYLIVVRAVPLSGQVIIWKYLITVD